MLTLMHDAMNSNNAMEKKSSRVILPQAMCLTIHPGHQL